MTRQFWALAAVSSLALAAGCASDPTGTLNGTPAYIESSLRTFRVNVGDSVRVVAELKDEQGVTLPTLPEPSSADPTIVSVNTATNDPLSQLAFYVVAEAYGTGTVLITSGSIVDSIEVTTFPASVVVAGAAEGDTIGSGSTVQLSPTPQDASGGTITVDDAFEWASDTETILEVDSTGLVTAKAPGRATITVTAPGGAEATLDLVVEPGVFSGTLSASSAAPNAMIMANRGTGDDAFDANTITTVGEVRAWTEVASADQLRIIVPTTGTAAAQDLLFTGLGADQTAKITTLTTTAAYGDGHPGSDAPLTAPTVTDARAASGFIYFAHSGHGAGAAARGQWNGGAQRDHFFQFTTGAAGATVSGVLEWFDGSDVDVGICLQVDIDDCADTFTSGSASDEVIAETDLDPLTTYVIVVSMWNGGSDHTNFRLTLEGI